MDVLNNNNRDCSVDLQAAANAVAVPASLTFSKPSSHVTDKPSTSQHTDVQTSSPNDSNDTSCSKAQPSATTVRQTISCSWLLSVYWLIMHSLFLSRGPLAYRLASSE